MKFTVNKNSFLENLLVPASKLAENISLNFTKGDGGSVLKTIVSNSDKSTILIANIPCAIEESFRCVVPDCKTFLRLFSGIDSEDDNITLEVVENVIKYSSLGLSFKFHLLDDFFLADKKTINEEKINGIPLDTKFVLTKEKFSEILKFNSIIPDAEKLYINTKNGKVYAKIGDELKANTNEISTFASESFEGKSITESLPLNIQNLLLMSFVEDKIGVAINHELKIFFFSTPHTKYVVSGLVK
jgi:hypothetical protein